VGDRSGNDNEGFLTSVIASQAAKFSPLSAEDLAGIRCLVEALREAIRSVNADTLRDTGFEAVEIFGEFVVAMLIGMAIFGVCVLLGAVIGGLLGAVIGIVVGGVVGFFAGEGVGAIPGAAAGLAVGTEMGGSLGARAGTRFGAWLLKYLGLVFIIEALAEALPKVGEKLLAYVELAWGARKLPPRQQHFRIKLAANELTGAMAILVKGILTALVIFGAAKGVPALIEALKSSPLRSLPKWLKDNWAKIEAKVREWKSQDQQTAKQKWHQQLEEERQQQARKNADAKERAWEQADADAAARAAALRRKQELQELLEQRRERLKQNQAAGDAHELDVKNFLEENYEDVKTQVKVRPRLDNGELSDKAVIVDYLCRDPDTGRLLVIDAKASETAPLTKNQTPGYPQIERNGGVVEGDQGGDAYPKGTEIKAPTEVVRVEPIDLPPKD
jgi:hypothetical protein